MSRLINKFLTHSSLTEIPVNKLKYPRFMISIRKFTQFLNIKFIYFNISRTLLIAVLTTLMLFYTHLKISLPSTLAINILSKKNKDESERNDFLLASKGD